MKILFLCEYFFPFDRGGSEWSIYHLAKSLVNQGHNVCVFTPNFGALSQENLEGITIYRFPYYLKLKKPHQSVSPFHFSNPMWWFWTIYFLLNVIRLQKPQVIQVHGKYFIPQAAIVGKLYRIPVIVTLRDYIVLCPTAYCMRTERNFRRCNFRELLTQDIPQYFKQFGVTGLPRRLLAILGTIYGWWVCIFLRLFLNWVQAKIAVSKKLQYIYAVNHLNLQAVIYNTYSTSKRIVSEKGTYLLFVGRLTEGKGFSMLMDAYAKLNLKNKPLLKIIGAGKSGKLIIPKYVEILGHLPYKKTLEFIAGASLVIVPSVWEEPFGRVALEAQMLGVPVVSTNRGGLPEIVEDQIIGIVVEPNVDALCQGIRIGLKNQTKLRLNLMKRKQKLREKFTIIPVLQYEKLYQSLI